MYAIKSSKFDVITSLQVANEVSLSRCLNPVYVAAEIFM